MTTLTVSTFATAVFPASADVDAIIRLALAEDVGRGDLTTEATVSPEAQATADLLQKAPGGGACGSTLAGRARACHGSCAARGGQETRASPPSCQGSSRSQVPTSGPRKR